MKIVLTKKINRTQARPPATTRYAGQNAANCPDSTARTTGAGVLTTSTAPKPEALEITPGFIVVNTSLRA